MGNTVLDSTRLDSTINEHGIGVLTVAIAQTTAIRQISLKITQHG